MFFAWKMITMMKITMLTATMLENLTIQNQQIFGVIPFVKLQNDSQTTAKLSKTMKNEVKLSEKLVSER